jgi:hypothetical protein
MGWTPAMALSFLDSLFNHQGYFFHRRNYYRPHNKFASRVDSIDAYPHSGERAQLAGIARLAADAAPAGISLHEALWWWDNAQVAMYDFTLISALPEQLRRWLSFHSVAMAADLAAGWSIAEQRNQLHATIGFGAVVADQHGDYAIGVSTCGTRLFEVADLDGLDSLDELGEDTAESLEAFMALGGLAELAEPYRLCKRFLNDTEAEPRLILERQAAAFMPQLPNQMVGAPFWEVVHAVASLQILDALQDAYLDAYAQGRLSDHWARYVLAG